MEPDLYTPLQYFVFVAQHTARLTRKVSFANEIAYSFFSHFLRNPFPPPLVFDALVVDFVVSIKDGCHLADSVTATRASNHNGENGVRGTAKASISGYVLPFSTTFREYERTI